MITSLKIPRLLSSSDIVFIMTGCARVSTNWKKFFCKLNTYRHWIVSLAALRNGEVR